MAFDKISLFSYLYGNQELENLSANKEVKVSSVEGLIEEDVDRSIHNMTRIGSEGMNETDRMLLEIMTNKN